MTSVLNKFKKPILDDSGIILYYHPYSFYSQKVLIILNEKKIQFTSYIVDLSNGEQYSDWFLNLNPNANVPVLQNGCFIIPNSSHIINYIEGKFNTTNYCRLISRESHEVKRIEFYEKLFASLPIGAISLGSFIHDDLKLNPKPPFIGPARKACLVSNDKVNSMLKSSLNNEEHNLTVLGKKLDYQERRREIVYNRDEFQKLLESVDDILKHIEKDLSENPQREWLCSSCLSIADITFGTLLNRLYTLGFEQFFWTNGKLPQIEKFFNKFKERESVTKSLPTSMSIIRDTWNMTPSNYKIGAGVLGVAMFAASALVHK